LDVHIPSSVPRRLAGDDQGITTPCLMPHKVLISVARIQKRQALRACVVGRRLEVRGLRKPLRLRPQCLTIGWSICPILNRNLSPLPRPSKKSPRVLRTVSLSVVRDRKFVLTITDGPKH
jgi:hypothetical protein